MTREEAIAKFRHKWLGRFADAWASRHLKPSEYGLLMDRQAREIDALIEEMRVEMSATPASNGKQEAKQERPAGWMPNAKGH